MRMHKSERGGSGLYSIGKVMNRYYITHVSDLSFIFIVLMCIEWGYTSHHIIYLISKLYMFIEYIVICLWDLILYCLMPTEQFQLGI